MSPTAICGQSSSAFRWVGLQQDRFSVLSIRGRKRRRQLLLYGCPTRRLHYALLFFCPSVRLSRPSESCIRFTCTSVQWRIVRAIPVRRQGHEVMILSATCQRQLVNIITMLSVLCHCTETLLAISPILRNTVL